MNLKEFDFDKLYLCRDSEYGTHVTYIGNYPKITYLDFYSSHENLEDIIEEILFYIKCDQTDKKKVKNKK